MPKEFKDTVNYEMTGPSPKMYWNHKADFVADMQKWGYTHNFK